MVKIITLSLTALLCLQLYAQADEATAKLSTERLVEPIFRVSKQDRSPTKTAPTALVKAPVVAPFPKLKNHPLDGALKMAQQALHRSRSEIEDYTAILVKRERIDGELNDESYMVAKVRNEKRNAGGSIDVPFSVYLRFLKPSSVKGREVIFVKGKNKGKLIAHEGGFKGKFTPSLHLDPQGTLAMMGQRYPITDIGIENLCTKLIARGNRDKAKGMCQVNITEATINKRPAQRIEVVHPKRKEGLDFHVARIFVDKEYELPVRYEAYDWPARPDGKVSTDDLIEEYTYIRLKFNVGLQDADFDPKNPNYNM